jgi:Na+/proline symporter
MFVLSAFLIRKALTSFEDYSYCGRSLGIGFVFFTYLGTWIGGGTIIGLVGRSHDYGASQYWIMAMACFVELFFAFFLIERIRDKEYKSITGFFASNYPMHGGIVRIPAASALLIIFGRLPIMATMMGIIGGLIICAAIPFSQQGSQLAGVTASLLISLLIMLIGCVRRMPYDR